MAREIGHRPPEIPPFLEAQSSIGFEVAVGLLGSEKEGRPNEDSVLVDSERGIFGIFDGMGGHGNGDVASAQASEEFGKLLQDKVFYDEATVGDRRKTFLVSRKMVDAFFKVNNTLLNIPTDEGGRRRPGTTASVVKIERVGDKIQMILGHVGDSRVYRYDSSVGYIDCLTPDANPFFSSFHTDFFGTNVDSILRSDQIAFICTRLQDMGRLDNVQGSLFRLFRKIDQTYEKTNISKIQRYFSQKTAVRNKDVCISTLATMSDNEIAEFLLDEYWLANRHYVSSALDGQSVGEIVIQEHTLQRGDILVFMTDGMTDCGLSDQAMLDILQSKSDDGFSTLPRAFESYVASQQEAAERAVQEGLDSVPLFKPDDRYCFFVRVI